MNIKLKTLKTTAEAIEDAEPKRIYKPLDVDLVISTGSTLLDLAISGNRIRGGGIPGGIMVEIYGRSSHGKTALAAEIGGSAQYHGGQVTVKDPEGKLDKEYAKTYDITIEPENYSRPDTVTEVFDELMEWEPSNNSVINVCIVDSIASLSTTMEMTEGDKRGQRKAKELSEGCRKVARKLADEHKVVLFTNQIRQGDHGDIAPGGFAVGFYATLRLRVKRIKKIDWKKKIDGVDQSKIIGIQSIVSCVKNHIDDEWREAPIYIMYRKGIDDVRANLQWLKDVTKSTKYNCVDKEYSVLRAAIEYIENNNLEADLREMVIDKWEQLEDAFKLQAKKKVRF